MALGSVTFVRRYRELLRGSTRKQKMTDSSYRAVVGLVREGGGFLIGKKVSRENHLLDGRWHVPGGEVGLGESYEKALLRELKEETGIEVKIEKLLGEIVHGKHDWNIRWYLCQTISGIVKAGDDLAEVKCVSARELLRLNSETPIPWPAEVIDYLKLQ